MRAAAPRRRASPRARARSTVWMASNSAASSALRLEHDARPARAGGVARAAAPGLRPSACAEARTAGSAAARARTSRANTTAAAGPPPITEAYEPSSAAARSCGLSAAREHDVGAAVVARHHQEAERPVEVHHRARDLGAVLELQLAHRLGRAVEAGEVREDDRRAVAARRVERARDLLGRQREERAAGPLRGAVERPVALARRRCWLSMPIRQHRHARRGARPRRSPSPRPTSGASARGSRRPGRSRACITARIANGRLRPGLLRVVEDLADGLKPPSPSPAYGHVGDRALARIARRERARPALAGHHVA